LKLAEILPPDNLVVWASGQPCGVSAEGHIDGDGCGAPWSMLIALDEAESL